MTRRPHSIQAWLVNWLGATVLVGIFFGLVYLAEQDMDRAAKLDALDAQVLAQEGRMQRAARALCRAELGLGAVPVWTPDGALMCRPRADAPVEVAEVRP